MFKLIRSSLLGLVVLPLAAQGTGISVTGGLVLGLDSLKKATNNTTGAVLGVDYNAHLYGTDIPARVGLSYAGFPGKATDYRLKTSLTLAQLHGDLLVGNAPVRGIVGLSLNKYTMYKSGQEDVSDAMDVNHHFPIMDVKGVKLGLRLGVEYSVTKQLAFELLLQQTELAGKDSVGDIQDNNGNPIVRQGGINPAWLQLGVTYRF